MRVADAAYTLSLLPARVASLWWKKASSSWMIGVALITAVALWADEIGRHTQSDGTLYLLFGLAWWAFIAALPGLIGVLILTTDSN